MRAFALLLLVSAGAIGAACGTFSGSSSDDDKGPSTDAAVADGGTSGATDASNSDGLDAGDASDAASCITLADDENVVGQLAPADPAIYWVNGTANAVRIYDGNSVATLFATPDGGALTGVAVNGVNIAWATDDGTTLGGRLHRDVLGGIGAGPSVAGVVPQSFQLSGSTVMGVALDRTQSNADLFLYAGATTYATLRPVTPPLGNAVTTSDGWVWVVANGTLQGLALSTTNTSEGPGISTPIATNGPSAFYIDGAQIIKTVGPAISPVTSGVNAVGVAADEFAVYYYSTPPSTVLRYIFATTALTEVTDMPAGADRLLATATYLYYVVAGNRVVRCNKPD